METVLYVFGKQYLIRALAYLIHAKRGVEAMRLISEKESTQAENLLICFAENYGNLRDLNLIAGLFKKHRYTPTNNDTLVADLMSITNVPADSNRYTRVSIDVDIIHRPVPERSPTVFPFINTMRNIHYENWIRLLLYYININDVTRAISAAQFIFIASGAWNKKEHRRVLPLFDVKENVNLTAQYKFAFNLTARVRNEDVGRLRSPFGVMCVELARKFPWAMNIAYFMLHSMSLRVVLMCVHAICMYEHDEISFTLLTPQTPLPRVPCSDVEILRSLPIVTLTGFRPLERGYKSSLIRSIDLRFKNVDHAELTTLKTDLVPRLRFDEDHEQMLNSWRREFQQLWDESYNLHVGIGLSELIEVKFHPLDSTEYLALTSSVTAKLTKRNSRIHWFVDPLNQRLVWYGPLTRYPNVFVAKVEVFKSLGAAVPQFNIYKRNQYEFFMVSSTNMLPETGETYPLLDVPNINLIDKSKAGMTVLADADDETMAQVFSSTEVIKALLLFWTIGMNLPKGDDIVLNPYDGKWYILGFHKQEYFPSAIASSSNLYQLLFHSSHGVQFARRVNRALSKYGNEIQMIADLINDHLPMIRDIFIKYGCAQYLPSDMNERIVSIKTSVYK
jgi:hypothetical protein